MPSIWEMKKIGPLSKNLSTYTVLKTIPNIWGVRSEVNFSLSLTVTYFSKFEIKTFNVWKTAFRRRRAAPFSDWPFFKNGQSLNGAARRCVPPVYYLTIAGAHRRYYLILIPNTLLPPCNKAIYLSFCPYFPFLFPVKEHPPTVNSLPMVII